MLGVGMCFKGILNGGLGANIMGRDFIEALFVPSYEIFDVLLIWRGPSGGTQASV